MLGRGVDDGRSETHGHVLHIYIRESSRSRKKRGNGTEPQMRPARKKEPSRAKSQLTAPLRGQLGRTRIPSVKRLYLSVTVFFQARRGKRAGGRKQHFWDSFFAHAWLEKRTGSGWTEQVEMQETLQSRILRATCHQNQRELTASSYLCPAVWRATCSTLWQPNAPPESEFGVSTLDTQSVPDALARLVLTWTVSYRAKSRQEAVACKKFSNDENHLLSPGPASPLAPQHGTSPYSS